MKLTLLIPAVASIALSVASLSAFALSDAERYGEAASSATAMRTIVVGPNTRWVNVTRREIVKLVVNGQELVWHFNGMLSSFKLGAIYSRDAVAQKVTVYIAISEAEKPSGG
jgi:heavy-metal resistance protein CzcE